MERSLLSTSLPGLSTSGTWRLRLTHARVPSSSAIIATALAAGLVIGSLPAVDWLNDAFPATDQGIALIFLVPVLLASAFAGMGGGLPVALMALAAWNWFYTPPYHSFGYSTPQHAIAQIIFVGVALLVGGLSTTLRKRARVAERRSRELAAISATSQTVASSLDSAQVVCLILDQIKALLDYTEAFALVVADGCMLLVEYRGGEVAGFEQGVTYPLSSAMLSLRIATVIDPKSVQALPLPIADLIKGTERRASSWLIAPLISSQRLVGVLGLGHTEVGCYSDRELEICSIFANQAAIAIDHARLYEQAQEAGVIEERARVARDLHDSVAQLLYGITLHVEAGRRALSLGRLDLAGERLEALDTAAGDALQEMRLLLFDLGPPQLESVGLSAALRLRIAAVESQLPGFTVISNVETVPRLPGPAEEAIYRIAQEALNNVLKHSGAKSVTVGLRAEESSVRMWVADDGVGFSADGSRRTRRGGLQTMTDRADLAGCGLRIDSRPGDGTRIEAVAAR